MLLVITAPIILFIGTFGNLLNFYIFTRPVFRSKSLSTFRFLAYLSIIDLFYLLIGLTHIIVINYTGYDFRNYSNFTCSIHSFLTLYLSHLSSNVLAGVSVFRCVTITNLKPVKPLNPTVGNVINRRSNKPFIQRFLSAFGHADLFVGCIMLTLFMFDCHYILWMRLSNVENSDTNLTAIWNEYFEHDIQLNESRSMPINTFIQQLNASDNDNYYVKTNLKICHPSDTDQKMYAQFLRHLWIWIDLFLYSYIPFTVMICCTILIIYRLFKINQNLKSNGPVSTTKNDSLRQNSTIGMASCIDATGCSSFAADARNRRKSASRSSLAKKTSRKNRQIYKLLLTLNIFFFVLVTPLVLANSLNLIKESNHLFRDFVYTLAYLNHSLHFLFYGFSCEIYRTILIDFLKKNFYFCK